MERCSTSLIIREMQIKTTRRTSLVVQWIGIHLPTQGTQVQSLLWEESTCWGTAEPMHNYWACALELASYDYWAHVFHLLSLCAQLLKPTLLEPVICNKRSHRNEKPMHGNEEWLPHTATTESSHMAMKTQSSQKERKKEKTTMRYYLTLLRMAIIKIYTNNKCWKGCTGKRILLHYWWEGRLVQPLWRTVSRFLKK